MVDLELKWGERFKLEKAIACENISLVDEIAETKASGIISDSLVNKYDNECEFCKVAKNQNNPQHKWRIRDQVVCNLTCSVNEMHRLHKYGCIDKVRQNNKNVMTHLQQTKHYKDI